MFFLLKFTQTKNKMDEIIKTIQLLFICNKNEDKNEYINCVNKLKEFNPRKLKQITEIFKILRTNITNNDRFEENELMFEIYFKLKI